MINNIEKHDEYFIWFNEFWEKYQIKKSIENVNLEGCEGIILDFSKLNDVPINKIKDDMFIECVQNKLKDVENVKVNVSRTEVEITWGYDRIEEI